MKKRILAVLIMNMFLVLCMFPCLAKTKENRTLKVIPFEEISIARETSEIAEVCNFEEQELTFSTIEAIEVEYTNKLAELEWREDLMQWFLEYKDMVEKYADIIGEPETIYNVYSEEEIYLMQRVIETETYQRDFLSKCNVANVILNRIEDPYQEFGKSVKEVITSPKQFAYGRKKISEDTKLALEFAYSICDTTNGAVAFHSFKTAKSKWGKWVYMFSDNSHHFYERNELLYE